MYNNIHSFSYISNIGSIPINVNKTDKADGQGDISYWRFVLIADSRGHSDSGVRSLSFSKLGWLQLL
jgi:hypothetical protein